MSRIPQGLLYGDTANSAKLIKHILFDLKGIPRCGHYDLAQIDWCVSCKVRGVIQDLEEVDRILSL